MKLKEQMKNIVPEPLLHLVPNRFEVIGDVAVISIPPELDDYKTDITNMIISGRKNIQTVLNKVAMLNGEDRTGKFELLLGSDTETLHREYGYLYHLDIRQVFFNSRLSYERHRVVSLVEPNEHVLIPFCGVGPFVVPVAARSLSVTAIEKNPKACKWLAKNIRLNRVNRNVSIIQGDAAHITNMIQRKFDRVILPIPYGMDHFLTKVSGLIKKEGCIHFYTFKKQYQIPFLIKEYADLGFEIVFYRRCGNVAPGVSRWVFDLVKH